MSRLRRRRRAFEQTRRCGESLFDSKVEVKTVDVVWKIFRSLKESVDELSETLRTVSKERTAQAESEEEEVPETVQVRPYASVPRRLELYVPWKSLQPFAQEMDAQVHLASSSHVFFPSLFNFVSGFEGGVTSFAVLQLTDAHLVGSMTALSAWDIGAVVSSRVCGALCGSTLLLCTSKETSSRDVLLWTAVGITAISIGTFFADRNTLLLLRFLAGLAEGVSSPAKAAYVVETVDAELRGASNGTRWAAFAIGSCAGVAAGALLQPIPGSWQMMFGICAAPAAVAGAGMLLLPHSPRWLAHADGESIAACGLHGDSQTLALASLKALRPQRKDEELLEELTMICQGSRKTQDSPNADVWEMLRHPATEISAMVNFVKQANGTIAVTTYLAPVMAAMGFQDHLATFSVVLTAVRSVSTPMGIVLMDRLGRRGSLLLGCLGSASSMSVLVFSHTFGGAGLMTMSFASLVASAALFELCWAPTSFQLTTELYPQELRQHGLALSHVFNYGVKALEMQLFPLVLNLAGLSPLFTAFAAVNCAGALAVYHMVPETCGRSLEEVEEQLWQEEQSEQ